MLKPKQAKYEQIRHYTSFFYQLIITNINIYIYIPFFEW